jgi:NADPH-dependent glutamate synthase beta subunit-like oxidoreductase/ferredoxin
MIGLTIDGKTIEVEAGKTILEAGLQTGIYIPNLCYHPDLSPTGACRLCIVEIEGRKGLPTACSTLVEDGMVVHSNTKKVQELRKDIIWLILSEYPFVLEVNTQLKKVSEWIGVKDVLSGFTSHHKGLPLVTDEPLFIRDMNKCILCRRCVSICQEVRKVGVIGFVNRGIDTVVGTQYDVPLKDADCKFCRACVEVCPSGALIDKKEYSDEDREKVLVPCKYACPANIDVPKYVRLIGEERFQDALEVIREKVPFPHTLGCVCPHPCEEACSRGEVNEPIAIRSLKRFVTEIDSGRWKSKIKIAPDTGKSVAIIGSGPAGLTCAWYLRLLGHSVTVFEALPEPGGTMRTGIPSYRLPRDILDKEVKNIEDIGVKIKINTMVKSTDELLTQGFDAVFLALGATEGMKMGIPGEDDPRVLDALSVLSAINLGSNVDIKGDIAVVGGGNSAIDVARSVLRLGAEKVTIIYRRTREEMPALPEEIEEALEEGITINFLTNPHKVNSCKDRLEVECIHMELGEPDESGRRRPVPIEGSEFTITADRLIMAIGQRPIIPKELNLVTTKWGTIKVNEETLSTSKDGVFAGGDVVSGPATVIDAIKAGRIAASSIDKYLGGSGQIEQQFVPDEGEIICLGREDGFAYKQRVKMPAIGVSERLTGFSQVELGYNEDMAVKEAIRCLTCQVRLKISRAPFPPEKDVKNT